MKKLLLGLKCCQPVSKSISLPYFDNLTQLFHFRYLNFLSDLEPYVLKAAQPFSY